jgi:hypothetical protein
MRRIGLAVALAVTHILASLSAEAQQPETVPRIVPQGTFGVNLRASPNSAPHLSFALIQSPNAARKGGLSSDQSPR